MANISTSIENWSTTAASNQPDSADTFSIVDDLRAIQAGVRREFASTTIASAGTMNIGAAAASYLAVSGNTTITAFDTVSAGVMRTLKFDGALTLTHNGTTLILPGGTSITTAAGDVAVFRSEGSGNWRCVSYQKANGNAVIDNTGIVNEGRLTLATGTPVTTTDQTAKTTVYWTPYFGKNISVYSGAAWVTFSQAELSVSVPANTSTPFDIFYNYNSGTPTLVATAWTNDTTRATALTTQDGVLVKSGTTTQRYLGTGRTTAVSGQTEDSVANRLLWNYYNRVVRHNRGVFTANRSTSSATLTELNTEIRCAFVIGVAEDSFLFTCSGTTYNAGANRNSSVIGIDSTSTGKIEGGNYHQMPSEYQGFSITHCEISSIGYHYATLLGATTAGTGTWVGGAASPQTNALLTVFGRR